MAFKMQCPKCGSSSLYLEEDQKAFIGDGRHQVQLHCYMCGKVIYGQDSIESEYKKQRTLWLSANNSTDGDSPSPVNDKEPAAPTAQAGDASSKEGGESSMPQCAWRLCEKVARPRSKYCSRNCSNKNARSRYSRRNDDENEAA